VSRQHKQSDDSDEDQDAWWHTVAAGVASLVCAGVFFWALSGKESSGGIIRAKWWLILIYSLGGKWLVAGIFTVLGLICIIGGLMQYFEKNES
jgi:hypothetical protein